MSSESEKLALATADAVVATLGRVERQGHAIDQLADVEGERVRAAQLAARFEDWATARLSPRRRRSEKLAAFDERVAKLEAEMAQFTERMSAIRERLPQADAEYRERLTRWHGEGSKGTRPESPLPALEAELQALQDDHGALEALISEALAEKVTWVEAHRDALIRDAERDSKEKHAAYADAADRLVEARDELIVARRDEIYFRLFPDPSLSAEPPTLMLAGGILARLRAAGFSTPFGIQELRRLLESDADFVSSMMTGDQRQALRSREPDPAPSPGDAVWTATPEGQEQVKRERREARAAYRREWGVWPEW